VYSTLSFSCPDYNGLNGTLPSELCALSNLKILSLVGGINKGGNYSLQGTIPSSLGKLTLLDKLQLGENLLTGSFPESFSDLLRLEHLYMDYNGLTGTIPTLLSIEYMHLEYNFFSGTLPGDVAYENLREVTLYYNMMSGSIPESLYSPTLQRLDLWTNYFTGSLSSRIGELTQLNWLDLGQNDLSGTIPSEIGELSDRLEYMYLDGNLFNGTIPSQMGSLTLLESLWLKDNQLSGTVPVEFSSLIALEAVSFLANNLTGSLGMFCNKTSLFTKVEADCGGVQPAVECSCCTACCDSLSGNCTENVEATCLVEKSFYDNENGGNYYDSGGTVCECTTGSASKNGIVTLSCMDTQCQSCNLDGSVCSMNERFEISFDENNFRSYLQSTFQYVVGRNDIVTLEWTRTPNSLLDFVCTATVNGQVCDACSISKCPDQYQGIVISCENVEGAGAVDVCDPKPEDTNGPLAVFAFQDSVRLQGCPPRFFQDIFNFV
jgi:Leucine-rich repeat (LRR) protein